MRVMVRDNPSLAFFSSHLILYRDLMERRSSRISKSIQKEVQEEIKASRDHLGRTRG